MVGDGASDPVDEWVEGDPCELCGEDGDDADPIAHFIDDARPDHVTKPLDLVRYVMAHYQCGEDRGLRLA